MRNSFSASVKKTFEKHGIEDEKLELVIAELFDDFQKHLLSPRNDFVKEITKRHNESRYSAHKQRRR